MRATLEKILTDFGLSDPASQMVILGLSLVAIIVLAYLVSRLTIHLMIPFFVRAAALSKSDWNDVLMGNRFFDHLSTLIPVVVVYATVDVLLAGHPFFAEVVRRLSMTILVYIAVQMINTVMYTVEEIYNRREEAKRKPISGYLSVIRIGLFVLAGIFIISTLTNKSPWGIFSVLGGLTAVVLLIFKDTILGFVASLQLVGHDMVRVGDWIEMPSFEADGDVIEVSIHTVKVQNWDKTITTIPTYALVSNAFKNWRGMSESGGRRIKRDISIDMNSVHFCSLELMEKLSKFSLLKEYLQEKQEEIDCYNRENNLENSMVPNGRRQTNIGVFRAYVKRYLLHHPKINTDMTFLVRHLPPTSRGLPMEIYVFSNDKVWANYEDIQADIFDHVLAVLPEFGLRVFQEPSGLDLQSLKVSVG
ncbi:MAG: mechanosensitive ion channel [Desulfobulbaceae bacterium]|uniref:Mechanosensing system component YbdG n=1 Tax=Candidatus Desulfatifera sulfidica TaxID=2841691 RepID=A0A8J6N8J1_9BACT|nr:mechanosensitive ion channel [Candidatus Desulfatifera sulfidica]